MKLIVKRFDKSIPLPSYKTSGSVCLDLSSRIDTTIIPGQIAYIPLNIAAKLPAGYWALLMPRSSTHKMGLVQINGVGVFDADYCGDNDEYLFAAYNFTDQPVTVAKGTRLCQLIILRFDPIEIEEVDKLAAPDRGGFGSTGQK